MPEYEQLKKNNGSSEFIEEICQSTWEPVYRFIYYKVQNKAEAEDITQETYVKAISYLQHGKIQPDKYVAFLKKVALNVLRDLWRKKQRQGNKVNIETINQKEVSYDDDYAETTVQRFEIEIALSQLNAEQRKIIELRILKGHSVAETARMLSKNEGNIRVIQYRALKQLAKIMKENETE